MSRLRAAAAFLALTWLALEAAPAGAEPSAAAHAARVERESAEVMPFDMDRSLHVFVPTADGGVQRVVSRDRDPGQIALIRRHLAHEAQAFAHGDYDDPASIHGDDMPGLAQLRSGWGRMRIRYASLALGGEIVYRTADPKLVAAVHRFFVAQRHDHGAHAMLMGQ